MQAEQYQRMDAIFEAALDLPQDERSAFLDTACGDDSELRQAIERLLELDEQAGDFMVHPLRPPPDLSGEIELENLAGQRLGPYLLLRRLGHGGMGSIYLAERQDEYHQQVAVKVMHRAFVSEEMQLRFRTERQALARLEHPHIARLYDGGTSDEGLPYLVMELIDGSPIDRYCDRNRLTVARRLRLFQALCSGVDHAHRNLLVHRDIKPTNVLVTASGIPKLLDFGIAKMLGPIRLSDEAVETDMQPMTPGYASPEQILGQAITTASDIYSLGVLLYELLSGRRPYRLTSEVPLIEVRRSVLTETPVPPSQRVLEPTDSRGRPVDAVELARQRGTEPKELRRCLQGDLDHIVMKAMRKDPEERYASAEELARDIGAYFAGRPVEAMADHWPYLASKFLQRHLLGAIAAGIVMLLLGASFLAIHKQASHAAMERNQAEAATQFLLELFEVSSPDGELATSYTTNQLLDLGSQRMRWELQNQEPSARANLLLTLGQLQCALGHDEKAESLLRQALAVGAANDALTSAEHVEILTLLADLARRQQHFEEAHGLYQEALTAQPRTARSPDDHRARAIIWQGQAALRSHQGDFEGATALLDQSLTLLHSLDDGQVSRPRARCQLQLAALKVRQQRFDEALELHMEGLEALSNLLGDLHPETVDAMHGLALLHRQGGDLEAFGRWQREVIDAKERFWGADHPEAQAARQELALAAAPSQQSSPQPSPTGR